MSIIQSIKNIFKPAPVLPIPVVPVRVGGKIVSLAIVNDRLGVIREVEDSGTVQHIFVDLKDEL